MQQHISIPITVQFNNRKIIASGAFGLTGRSRWNAIHVAEWPRKRYYLFPNDSPGVDTWRIIWKQNNSIRLLEAAHVPVSSVVTCLEVQFDNHLTFKTSLVVVSTIFGSYGLWGGRWQRIQPRLRCTHYSQSSRLLRQCVVSDKPHCHKDPPVSLALSCGTYNAGAEVWAHNTDTSI